MISRQINDWISQAAVVRSAGAAWTPETDNLRMYQNPTVYPCPRARAAHAAEEDMAVGSVGDPRCLDPGGLGSLEIPSNQWAASRPSGWWGFPIRRGLRDPKNRRPPHVLKRRTWLWGRPEILSQNFPTSAANQQHQQNQL
jgi:hypothetical protein